MTSITNALLLFWKRQSCHPSRSGNTLSSICLGNSALTFERLQEHYTTWWAYVSTQKILGPPLWRLYTMFQCFHPCWSAKSLLSSLDKRNSQPLQDSQWPLVCGAMDKNLSWSCHIQPEEVYAEVQASVLLSDQHDSITPWALARVYSTLFQHFLHMGPHFLNNRRWGSLKSLLEGFLINNLDLMFCMRLVHHISPGFSKKTSWYSMSRAWADVWFAPDSSLQSW